MRRVVIFLLISGLTGGEAYAFQECNGHPHVRVLWQKQIIEVDDTFYQMKREKIAKKSERLVGHNMVFVHSGSGDTLIRDGVSTSYSCVDGEGQVGLKKATVQAYEANPFVESKTPVADETITGSRSSPSSGKGHGHGGGGKNK
ncbi:MAG: hypothetical protein KGI75_00175 [Rhizobiaceae bacterium]|nr:hypothetical protein [Rhizobiaceae bacterium]